MYAYKYSVLIFTEPMFEDTMPEAQVVAEGLEEEFAIILLKALLQEYYNEEGLQVTIRRERCEEVADE